MKKLDIEERQELIDCAMGRIDSDLIIKDVNIFNVFTKEIYPGEIYIKNGFIAYIEQRKEFFNSKSGKEIISAQQKIAIPGFIDSHMHIESTLLTPQNLSNLIIPRGTTTIITDPHEIGNVLGIKGVEYMIDSGKKTFMNQFVLVPSCVPAVPSLENSGANFDTTEIKYLLQKENVLGIAEVMDYFGVINKSEKMKRILDLGINKEVFIQGHFFGENPREIAAYLCAGVQSNHEFISAKDAKLALENGMIIDVRNSSFAKNISEIISSLKDCDTFDRITFCTDDREPEELVNNGHIDDCIKDAINSGMTFGEAIKSATIIPAKHFKLNNLGAIAPGYQANINLINSESDMLVTDVFYEGKLVAKNNKMVKFYPKYEHEVESINTINIGNFDFENLKIKAPIQNGLINTRVIKYVAIDSSITEEEIIKMKVKDGYLTLEGCENLNFIAVINRYNNETFSLGIVKDFYLTEGALAGTVSHDCHNLTVVYKNWKDAKKAIQEIERIKGGIVYSFNNFIKEVSLPIAGLMSKLRADEIINQVKELNSFLKTVGIDNDNPLMRSATATLPVVPNIKISDLGIIDTNNQKIVPLFS